MKLTADQRREILADASRADLGSVLTLRAMGESGAITTARRDELLAKCMAGEYVELELELEAYSQAPGTTNRKFIRIRDGAMQALGRSGKTTPLMRDHDQGNVLARGGTITASATENPVEGHYAIRQTAKLTAPWAVEMALRGLLDRLSIGICPTGPLLCSLCGTEVLDDCWHWRGDVVTAEDGSEQVCEWIFTSGELVETSVVSVPAVKTAHIEAIRSALALGADTGNRGAPPQRNVMDPKLLALLGLAATAGIPEATAAVENLQRERNEARAELAIATSSLATATAELAIANGENKASAEDKFITDAILSGRITKGDEPLWRAMYVASSKRAGALMAKRAEGSATPVGVQRQSAVDPSPAPNAAPALPAAASAALAASGVDGGRVIEFATAFGAPDPAKNVASHATGKGA